MICTASLRSGRESVAMVDRPMTAENLKGLGDLATDN
jgi:hypothetical protein